MAKKYNSNWLAKEMIVNFNEKQWRQDFASFVEKKKFWFITKVTRSKAISQRIKDKGIKWFDVYNEYGNIVRVTYKNNNTILKTTDAEIVDEYLKSRGVF